MAKKKARVRLVDTTFRDAQQSLLGGYLRTEEILPIAAKMDSIGFAAMEAFGGATFETQLSIHEDPWEYLRKLNKVMSDTVDDPTIRKRLQDLGLEILPPEQRSPEYLAKYLPQEVERWGKVIKAAGISAD